MPLTLKLVGSITDPSIPHEIFLNYNEKYNAQFVKELLCDNGISEIDYYNDEFKIIIDSHHLDKRGTKDYNPEFQRQGTIFLFSSNKDIKESLMNFFKNNTSRKDDDSSKKYDDSSKKDDGETFLSSDIPTVNFERPDLTMPIEQAVDITITKPIIDFVEEKDEPLVITNEIIESMNKKIIEKFNNKDFKDLIRIYFDNPSIFKDFIGYIINGDIINVGFEEQEKDYSNEINTLKELGIKCEDSKIKSTLQSVNGHLNLALRKLLYENSSNIQDLI